MKYAICKPIVILSIFNSITVHLSRQRYLQSLRNANYVKRRKYWKFVLKIKETPFMKTQISQFFSGGACPRTLVKSASRARLSVGRVIYIRNSSKQKGWLRPCVLRTVFSSDSVSLCTLTRTKKQKKAVIKNQCNLELEWSNLKMLGSGFRAKCVWAAGSTAKTESGLQSVKW